MRNWFQSWLGHIFLGLIALDHLWERIKPACEKCKEVGKFIERRINQRRKTMSLISEVEAVMALEPLIVQFVEDAIQAAPTLEADGKAILAKVESIFHGGSTTTTTTTTSPAA
jgi:hypothetical protein